MDIKAKEVYKLRKETGAPMMDCKKALVESKGDKKKAIEILRKKGASVAQKRAGREAKEGIIASYIHNGKIGVLVEINSETDFVAKNKDFREFAEDIAMHIAAMDPKYLKPDNVPRSTLKEEEKIEVAKMVKDKKPKEIQKKIWEGKKKKYFRENCLLKQSFVKNEDISVEDHLNEITAKIGEKIDISRFIRYEVGK